MFKIIKYLYPVFVLYCIPIFGQNTKSTSFAKYGQIEKITVRKFSAFLEAAGLNNISKNEYYFNKDGMLIKEYDSLFNSVTYYYYTENHFCDKQITKVDNKIKFIITLEKTDTCIISKTFDSLMVLLFTSFTKVNDLDNIIYKKTVSVSGYIEILTFDYNKDLLPIKSTYWSEGMDYKTDIHYKDEIKDKLGNWIKCTSASDLLFKEQTILIREIVYR